MATLCAAVDGEAAAANDDLIKAQAKVRSEETCSEMLAMKLFSIMPACSCVGEESNPSQRQTARPQCRK